MINYYHHYKDFIYSKYLRYR